jgi:hypothetical protein
MIIDDKLWHVCFVAGEDGRYNELVEADCPATAIAMVKEWHSDWRADAPFTVSAIRVIFGRVVESDPIDLHDYHDGTKFRFRGVRHCDYGMAKRPYTRCEARR